MRLTTICARSGVLLATILGVAEPVAFAQRADSAGPPAPGHPIDVWLDVDAANGVGDVDDGLMLIQAFHSSELRVRGVSAVFGNTDLDKAEHVARQIVSRFGPTGLEVHRGAASSDDLGEPSDAVEAMAAALREAPMSIAAVGPVTNVGTLLTLYPELRARIDRVIVVAGRRPGQEFILERFRGRGKAPPSDFNFELDPRAMQVILDSGVPLVLAPWEVSSKVWIGREDLARLSPRSDAAAWIDRTSQYWVDRWERGLGVAAFNPYDTLAIGWLTHPTLVDGIPVRVRIEEGEGTSVAGGQKVYLHVFPAQAGDLAHDSAGTALYLTTPRERFKDVLLDRLPGPPDAPDQTLGSVGVDHSLLDRTLRRNVDDRGMVDYAGLKADSSELDAYIASLGSVDLRALPRDERLALLINAYNAFTLRLILDHHPVSSIKDIPRAKRWKAARWSLAGATVSLDDIEHRMIRPVFEDPRIHFALVCAAKGCPPLRNEAYTGRWLDAQLDDQSRTVHADERWLRLDGEAGVLLLSSLYKWYAEDFETQGGRDMTVVRHAARYAPSLRSLLRKGSTARIQWMDYDWSLNAQ